MNYEEESRKLLPGKKELMKGVDSCCHYREVFTHNLLLGTCQKVLAKQILKNEELQEQLSNWLQLELDYNKRIKELEAKIKENEKSISDVLTQRDMWKTDYAELQAENKKLEEQQLTEDAIAEIVLQTNKDWDNYEGFDNFELFIAKAIIKAIEEKQTRTCDPECPFCKTEEASK